MKTLKSIFLILTCFGLLLSCSKDDVLVEDQAEMTLLKGKSKMKGTRPAVFTVEPNGVDDTQNLNDAFTDAINAGACSVVELAAGTFYIDLIEIRDFHGTLKGAGKGNTVITTIDGLSLDEVNGQNLFPALLKFVGGDVYLKDLSLRSDAENPDWLEGLVAFFGWSQVYEPENSYINAKVDNIEIIGQPFNVGYGLMTGSDSRGLPEGVPFANIDISVTNSYFANCAWYGAVIMMIKKGNVVVGTKKNNGNTFVSPDGWSYGNLGFWHFVNTKISVVGNHFQGQGGRNGGLDLFSAPYLAHHQAAAQNFASVATIEHNTFDVSNFVSAIIINDNRRFEYPEDEPMRVQLKSNRIHTDGNTMALIGLNVDGTIIRNNKFTGNAAKGILLLGEGDVYNENGLILGNNFSNAIYSVATVHFGVNTRNWTIVGGNLGESVLDEGENNRITGCKNNTRGVALGKTIVDSPDLMRLPMHDLKGH